MEGFNEEDLYEDLDWLAEHQERIEETLFRWRCAVKPPTLFLYDVTSSYLEGECNALGAYGYNRDGKRGKKQIVIGLLCDGEGEPLSVRVFEGNTNDLKTFGQAVQAAAERFGCRHVTFVGDRGMIESAQKGLLKEEGFWHITALTKPQIEGLLAKGALQLELFEDTLAEVMPEEGGRYVLRRELARCWRELDVTVEEGLDELKKLCRIEVVVKGRPAFSRLPKPSGLGLQLLAAAGVELPPVLPTRNAKVATKKKLPSRRLSR